MRTRIKFCGMTRAEDAAAAVAAGADAIGLILAAGSPRFIGPDRAGMIRRRLPPFVQAVVLFRNAATAEVHDAIAQLRPDLLQFHGEETPEFCASFGVPFMKAVPMAGVADLEDWQGRFGSAAALLLDAHAPGEPGGLGRTFDWGAVPAARRVPIVLAGGLTPDNVGAAVRRVRPYAVDVSTGVESAPGIKDPEKMRRFVEAVRMADEA